MARLTLIIYDYEGYIYLTYTGTYRVPQGGIQYLETEIPNNKKLVGIDISVTPHKPILEDIDTRISDISSYLENADDTTISKVEDTILETESNKILDENGGM